MLYKINMKTKQSKLDEHLKAGIIFIDGTLYIAKAADGIEVVIGYVGNENSLEDYLQNYPTPKDW